MRISGIYKIINKVNGKYYVGSSKDTFTENEGRKYYHWWGLKGDRHYNEHLQRAWNKYGEENFEFIVIEKDVKIEDLFIIEQKYLDIAKNEQDRCYNKSFIAGRIDFTKEVRAKMGANSRARFGNRETNPNVGRPCSEDTRTKISKANTGKRRSQDVKDKISRSKIGKFCGKDNPSFGIPKSDEVKRKISLACKGKNSGKENYRYSPVVYTFYNELKNLEFIGTYQEFYKTFSLEAAGVSLLVSGKRENAWGWKIKNSPFKRPLLKKDFKGYKLISPTGEIFEIENLAKFCRENNFKQAGFCDVLKGRAEKNYGWRIEYSQIIL